MEAGRARVSAAYIAYAQGLGYARRNGLDNIEKAITHFSDAVRLDPAYALATSGLSSTLALKYEITKDPQCLELAITNAEKAVSLAPDLAQVHFVLGQLDVSKGKNEQAEKELKRALDLDPDIIEALFYLGRLHAKEGKFSVAARDFRDAVARRPEYWRCHSELGTFYYKKGQFNNAESEFIEALRVQPDQPEPLQNLAGIYMATGKFKEAVPVLENLLRVKPDDGTGYSNLGAALIFLGKYRDAVLPMERAVQLTPNHLDCWRNLGDALQASGQPREATDAYRKALILAKRQLIINPSDWETMASLALFHAHLKNRQEAIRLADRLSEVAPVDNEVSFTSALAYELSGKRASALSAIATAYMNGYSLDDIEHEPVLNELRKDSRFQAWIKSTKNHLTPRQR